MSDSEENFTFEDKRLSLIDVSFEDDCLYNPPSQDNQIPYFTDNQKEHTTVQLPDMQAPGGFLQEDERVIQPLESVEQENTRKNEKYNLRKSLAWDSAFFTSAGVLEPEELSNMIGGTEKGRKNHILLGIEEDIHRSTDSISTLATDNSMLETLEDDLFEDIRASIKKSNKASSAAISRSKTGSEVNEGQLINSSEKVGTATQNKLKTKTSPKKPNAVIKGSGKLTNHVSPNQQALKSGSINGESTSSLCKPPKIVGRVSPILTTATKRASLGANCVKMEKESAKNSNGHSDNRRKLTVAGRGAKLPTLGGSRNTVPKPKSSSQSSVASKMELTTSSSIDSSGSLSSDSSSKHSLNTVKRKIDPKTGNHSSIGLAAKTTLRTTSRDKNPSMNSRLSPCLKSMAKPSSAPSPSSSISQWSLESFSPTSSLTKGSSSSRPSLDTSSCKDASENGDASQVLDFQNRSTDKCSVGHGTQVTGLSSEAVKRVSARSAAPVRPDPIKPSGLRMPSPKIGFFDGVRSTVATPNGSLQSQRAVPSGLLRHGAANGCPRGGSNETKLGKHQPARTVMAVRRSKTVPQQHALEIKPKTPLPLEPSNAAPKVCALRNGKYCPDMPLRVQNRISTGKGGQSSLKAVKIAPKKCNAAINNPDIGYAEWDDSLHKDKMSPQTKGNGPVKDADYTLINGGFGATHNSNSVSEAENIIWSQKVGENVISGPQKNLDCLSNTTEKEKICFDDQVVVLAQKVGAADILREIQQKPVLDCSLYQVHESREANSTAPEESVKLSSPAPSIIPTEGVNLEIDES